MAMISANVISDELLEGDGGNDQVTGKSASPETELWLAVIDRAWLDAFTATDETLRNIYRTADPAVTRGEARRWLTLNFGDWREDREMVCDLASLDPDAVRATAVRRLALAKIEDIDQRVAKIEALDRTFESLVARAGTLTKRHVTRTMRV